mgnify:CR=1 FL=1
MEIESFLKKSEGNWISMRSGHSLAFKQFEEVISNLNIKILNANDYRIINFLDKSNFKKKKPICPFEIKWEGNSNWQEGNAAKELSGSSLLIPIPHSSNKGIILRSLGYAEKIEAISNFNFTSDGTMILSTEYSQTIAEERIWFINKNVRCRSSVIKSIDSKGIFQTSFASEIRCIS